MNDDGVRIFAGIDGQAGLRQSENRRGGVGADAWTADRKLDYRRRCVGDERTGKAQTRQVVETDKIGRRDHLFGTVAAGAAAVYGYFHFGTLHEDRRESLNGQRRLRTGRQRAEQDTGVRFRAGRGTGTGNDQQTHQRSLAMPQNERRKTGQTVRQRQPPSRFGRQGIPNPRRTGTRRNRRRNHQKTQSRKKHGLQVSVPRKPSLG